MPNSVAANVLGTLGAICWSVQLIPQIIINHRRHNTEGLQPTMMLLWASAGLPLGVYNIVENFNVALKIQPQILTLLSLITWAQCKYYGSKWPIHRTIAIIIPVMVVMGGIEFGLVFALKKGREHGLHWPNVLMAVLSACLLSAGVLRHYWDIYKEHTVRGISFLFVGIDALGDLTSLISVFFEPNLDILGMIIYGSELILWLGVFACGGYFNFRPWLRTRINRKRHASEQERVEDVEVESQAPEARATTSSAISRQLSTQSESSSRSRTVFRTASSCQEIE